MRIANGAVERESRQWAYTRHRLEIGADIDALCETAYLPIKVSELATKHLSHRNQSHQVCPNSIAVPHSLAQHLCDLEAQLPRAIANTHARAVTVEDRTDCRIGAYSAVKYRSANIQLDPNVVLIGSIDMYPGAN
tara:strand:+ start:808 stop:1212 length:405 start_codon:yes stop_codon:yes gene_type:complete